MKTILLLLLMVISYGFSFSQIRKMVGIGSSTTAGLKATPLDSSWVSRFNYYYKKQLGILDSTYNLGVGGTTPYHGMPSGYSKPGRPSPNPEKNITKAFSLLSDLSIAENGVVIVNYPTNGYENYSIAEILTALQIIYDSATRTGHRCYMTTTQPRTSGTFGTSLIKKKLAIIKDSIIDRFGVEHTLNFWDGMYNPADTTILAIYSSGDKTHFNNAGHKVLFNRVVEKNMFNLPLPAVDDYRSNVVNSGNWETPSNWLRWNGMAWVVATDPPNSTSGAITILGDDIITITSDLTANGNITINPGGTISAGSTTIDLKGNWINNEGTFTSTGSVIFSGSADQEITGTTTFANVTIAKTGNLTLNGTTTINGILTLNDGIIISSSTFPLQLGSSASLAGGSSTSFIMGPVQKRIDVGGTFTFPVGDIVNNRYRPLIIFATGQTDDWTVAYVGNNPTTSSHPTTSINAANIGSVSTFEFWNITPSNISNSAGLTLTYNTGSYQPPNIANVDNLLVVHWDALNNRWDKPSGGGVFSQGGSNINGTVTVQEVNSFSPFTLGSLDVDSPLPVTWSSFVASRVEKTVVLDWKTAHEWNNNRFEVERSIDGQRFNSIGSKKAVGNSNIIQRYQFIDHEVSDHITYYYRIRQVDFDDKFDFSSVVAVVTMGKSNNRWVIWPNPLNTQQPFSIIDLDKAENFVPVVVKITSPNGAVLFTDNGFLNDLSDKVEKLLQKSSAGVYVVHLSDGFYQEHFRMVRY